MNNAGRFLLAIDEHHHHKAVGLADNKTRTDKHFLLSVPAGEDSLAHRRHVCSRAIASSEYSPTNRLDLKEIFGRKAPLQVDLGCGDGLFICAMAQSLPDKNFLGIERLSARVRSAAHRAAGLSNVRLLQVESSYAVQYLLPAASVEIFYLLFPDPWPKRRHHRRRIVTTDFLNSVHTALEMDGTIYIATDHVEYFGKIKQIADSNHGFAVRAAALDLPKSKFGHVFGQTGTPIHSLALGKISPVK